MVWLIGNKGMLGSELALHLGGAGIDFIGTDRDVDITDFDALNNFAHAQKEKISFIINCSAYTAVDKAEDEPELAEKLNADGPGNIARTAKLIGAKMIHISTDYVFDGSADSPYTEDSQVNPIGVYGKTKAGGECSIARETDEFYIVRTAWLYGKYGRNFVRTMIDVINLRDEVRVVSDQYGSPTNASDLADAIVKIITLDSENKAVPFGIYHCTNSGETTWYEFTREIQKQALPRGMINHDCKVNPCTTAEYPTKARRPAYSVLCKDKIQQTLGIRLPQWKESLSRFLDSLQEV